jgi:DnaJ family protein A protein 2
VIADNAIKRVPHEGMPQQRHIENKGDLIISFKVKYPEALAPQQCAVLEKALGPKPPMAEVCPSAG